MLARFFVNRPIFAWVISFVIMIAGTISLYVLPVEQYPDIAPPQINISATYSGASAQTVENSITQIIEQQLTGLDGMIYFSSSSSSAGTARIKVTFQQGTDPDIAQVQVQNKVEQILSRLPDDVQKQGVRVAKAQTDFLLLASIYDSTSKADKTEIADYLVSNLQDSIARIEGVGEVQVFGGQYAMRIWLNPTKLEAYNLMPSDIESAISAQNSQASAGKLGALPVINNQQLSVTVTARSKFKSVDEFENILVKHNSNGSFVKLKDVARIEIGAQSYSNVTGLNGMPSSGIAIQLGSGANAIKTANSIKELLKKYEPTLPEGYKVAYPRDTTLFIQASIKEVIKTLFEAILLVVIVMYIFLKSWRATLIPAIAVPVVLLGTFGILNIFGYSINTLTMFGMVLSIGLLVDDAIVVVENVERNMNEKQLLPKEATIVSMQEITSALIGVATVLSVVFLPMAFFSGATGVIYRQFSITIISSMVLSIIIALTLTPALCATILKPHNKDEKQKGFTHWFGEKFDVLTLKYKNGINKVLQMPIRWLVAYVLIIASLIFVFIKLPTSFLPKEDQGSLMVQYTLPVGAITSRTVEVAEKIKEYFLTQESNNINSIFTISGYSSNSSGQNVGTAYVSLKSWDLRPDISSRSDIIGQRAAQTFADPTSPYFIRDAKVISMNPPVIQGLGSTDGFEFQLQADALTSRTTLAEVKDKILLEAGQNNKINSIRSDGTDNTPQLKIEYDTAKALALGLSMSNIDYTLSAAWGGIYVNDFIDRSRVKRVYIQGDAPFRSKPEDLYIWKVRNSNGTMTSFSEFATTRWDYGPEELTRYNGFASFQIQGSAANGTSSGVAMDEMDKLADKLSNGTMHSWSGLSYQERLSSGQAGLLYAVSILIIFLCLAALYESWSVPFSILLVVPLGVIGAVIAVYFRGLDNNVYFQVALLTTIGLAAKNAILIVEFVDTAYKNGKPLLEAAIEGATLRLRPIIMTSLAFVAGIMPLAISTGAGANSRISIGTGIVGGTLTATIFAIFFVPLFFVLIKKVFSSKKVEQNV